MDKGIIKALYSMRKDQVIQFYKINPENSYPTSYAYAIANDCYPFFNAHEDPVIFADCYNVKKEFIDTFTKYLDEECFLKRDYKSFYDLERKFGRGKRIEMIIILRYCYLDGLFNDKAFWDSITENGKCPAEVLSLTRKFELYEL